MGLFLIIPSYVSAAPTVSTQPDNSVKESPFYEVKVTQGNSTKSSFVYITEAPDGGDAMWPILTDRSLSFTSFTFKPSDGPVTVEVIKKIGQKAPNIQISPKSYNIKPDYFDGKKVKFTLSKCINQKISINFQSEDNIDNDPEYPHDDYQKAAYEKQIKNGLMIFVDAPEPTIKMPNGETRNIPKINDPGVVVYKDSLTLKELQDAKTIYFPKGVYDLNKNKDLVRTYDDFHHKNLPVPLDGVLTLANNQTVYIAKDAFVYGAINGYGKSNIAIAGRGIISGAKDAREDWVADHLPMFDFRSYGGGNLYMEGITIVDQPFHGLVTPNKTKVLNTKQMNWRANCDGMRNSDDTIIRDVFIKTADDFFYATTKTSIENSVLWPMWNGALFMLGWGDYGGSGTRVKNIDVINPEYTHLGNNQGIVASQVYVSSQNEDVVLENIRIEGAINALANLHYRNASEYPQNYTLPRDGYIKNITFKNITIDHPFITDFNNKKQTKNIIKGTTYNNKKYYVQDITFENVKINNQYVTQNNYKNYFDINPNTTKNITFKTTTLNNSAKKEAENADFIFGVQSENCSEGGKNIGFIENNDYIGFKNINLTNIKKINARVASGSIGGKIEIRLNNPNGTLIGTINVNNTGGWQSWKTVNARINNTSGNKSVYFVFKGSSGFLMNLNWVSFKK